MNNQKQESDRTITPQHHHLQTQTRWSDRQSRKTHINLNRGQGLLWFSGQPEGSPDFLAKVEKIQSIGQGKPPQG